MLHLTPILLYSTSKDSAKLQSSFSLYKLSIRIPEPITVLFLIKLKQRSPKFTLNPETSSFKTEIRFIGLNYSQYLRPNDKFLCVQFEPSYGSYI